jgi:hypothetical protein
MRPLECRQPTEEWLVCGQRHANWHVVDARSNHRLDAGHLGRPTSACHTENNVVFPAHVTEEHGPSRLDQSIEGQLMLSCKCLKPVRVLARKTYRFESNEICGAGISVASSIKLEWSG